MVLREKLCEKDDEKDIETSRNDFNEEDTKRFRKIQDILGIQNKSDVIRFCLTYTYQNYPKIVSIINHSDEIKKSVGKHEIIPDWKKKRVENLIKARKEYEVITHKEACVLLSCSPAILFINNLNIKYNRIKNLNCDFNKLLKIREKAYENQQKRFDNLITLGKENRENGFHELYLKQNTLAFSKYGNCNFIINKIKTVRALINIQKSHKINFNALKTLHKKYTEFLFYKLPTTSKIQIRVGVSLYSYYTFIIRKKRRSLSLETIAWLCNCSPASISNAYHRLISYLENKSEIWRSD